MTVIYKVKCIPQAICVYFKQINVYDSNFLPKVFETQLSIHTIV